jgi:hypothetical protein
MPKPEPSRRLDFSQPLQKPPPSTADKIAAGELVAGDWPPPLPSAPPAPPTIPVPPPSPSTMASPPPPDVNCNPSTKSHPNSQHISPQEIPPDWARLTENLQENFEGNQAFQRSKELQLAGDMLAQISFKEDKEAERKKQGKWKSQPVKGTEKDCLFSSQADRNTPEEEVDLAAIMKSLQITIPEDIEIGYQGEEVQKPEESTPYRLLMKVACSSGTPRNIPLKALNDAMSSAWGEKYWIIEQVKPALYIAYFRTEEAMDFVLKRQPWSVESDNLLLEWINPGDFDREFEDYHFRYIYVPIRVYGVPEKFRTPSLMRFVIDNSAQLSDLHPPPEINMTVRKDFIQAYAKMDVQKPVKDKVKYFVSPNDYILFYLNYDKVKRICVFCGMMFHSVQNCPNRSKLIRHLQSIKVNTSEVPFSNIGIWTSQAKKFHMMRSNNQLW